MKKCEINSFQSDILSKIFDKDSQLDLFSPVQERVPMICGGFVALQVVDQLETHLVAAQVNTSVRVSNCREDSDGPLVSQPIVLKAAIAVKRAKICTTTFANFQNVSLIDLIS